MSLRDENLKDKHLQKALQHAPDSDAAPSDVARKAVLDYADKALKTRLETQKNTKQLSWFARVKNWFISWKIPNWQLTGIGSLAASLLVVVMIWHENPDELIQIDPVQVATAPEAASGAEPRSEASPEPSPGIELAQNELAKDDVNKIEQSSQIANESAPAAASAEMAAPKPQDKAKENVLAKASPSKIESETAPQASIEAPSRQAPEKEADSARAKEAAVIAEAAPPAPVAAAPVAAGPTPVAESAPAMASAGASAGAASEQTMARATARPETTSKAAKKMEDAEQGQASAKAGVSSASVGDSAQGEKRRLTTKRFGDDPLAKTIVQLGGVAMANQDIQAGKLRILEIADYYKGKPSDCEEPYTTVSEPRVDAQTAYKVEEVYVCVAIQQLKKDVELYNQTMRDWFKLQH